MKVPTVFEAVTSLALAAMSFVGVSQSNPADCSDEKIETSIVEIIRTDADMTYSVVNVAAKEGVVTLTGEADSLLHKQRASQLSQKVPGVRIVVNRLEVRSGRVVLPPRATAPGEGAHPQLTD